MSIEMEDIESEITNITLLIADKIKGHMEDQPYKINCSECGAYINVDCSVDSDFDLTVKVSPHTCGG